MIAQPTFLMCPPKYYKILKPNNEIGKPNDFCEQGWQEYNSDKEGFRKRAYQKWEALKNLLETKIGAQVELLEPEEALDDQVFTADGSLSLLDGDSEISLISFFSNEKRQGEIEAHAEFIMDRFPMRKQVPMHFQTEGTGDNVYDPFRDLYWSGYTKTPGKENAATGRSDIRSHFFISSGTGVRVVSLQVQRPFFHVDTMLAPLSKGHMLCYENGVTPKSYDRFKKNAFADYGLDEEQYLIKVSQEDAYKYACNLVCHGDVVVMPECSEQLQEEIESKGYKVFTTNLDEFILSGGGPHCLVNNITQQRIKGGLINVEKSI